MKPIYEPKGKAKEPLYHLLMDVFSDENTYIDTNATENIKETFRSLTEIELKFIIMKYKNKYTYEKIALINNTNISKVSETILRALSRLRNQRNTNIIIYGLDKNQKNYNSSIRNMTIEEFKIDDLHIP